MKCKVCHTSKLGLRLSPDGICLRCIKKRASAHWPKPARPHRPCARCNHGSIIRCVAIRERSSTEGDYSREYAAPLSITYAVKKVRELFGPEKMVVDYQEPIGFLETYVCRSCGFTEFYTQWPALIPIGPDYLTELIDTGPSAPFR